VALCKRQTQAYRNVARSQISIAVALGHQEIRTIDDGETAVSRWERGGVRARTASAFKVSDGLPAWVWPLVDGALAANIERAEADYNHMERTGICVRPPAPLPQSGLGVLMESYRWDNNLQPLSPVPLFQRQAGLVIADFEANPEPSYDECMKIGVKIHVLVDDVVRHFKLLRKRVRQNTTERSGRGEHNLACFSAMLPSRFKALPETYAEPVRELECEKHDRQITDLVARAHPDFVCPISHTLMRDPVLAADGHSYERRMIEEWFARGSMQSPMPNAYVSNTRVFPEITLKKAIKRALEVQMAAGARQEPPVTPELYTRDPTIQ